MSLSTLWNDSFNTKPTGSDLLGQMDNFILATRQGTKERIAQEHLFDVEVNDRQGLHKEGSARVWVAESPGPTDPVPAAVEADNDSTKGRIWVVINSDGEPTGDVKVHDGSAWVSIGGFMPAGAMMPFGNTTAPEGWLECNGQAVDRTTYARLFAAIGVTWGVGNGSTTFNVPDLREAVPVGAGSFSLVTGSNRGALTSHDAYTVSQYKDDQIQGHAHGSVDGIKTYIANSASGGSGYPLVTAIEGIGGVTTDSTFGAARFDTVTRGKRIGVLWCIRT